MRREWSRFGLAALLLSCGADTTRILLDAPPPSPEGSAAQPPPLLDVPLASPPTCALNATWPVSGARDVPITVQPELRFDGAPDPALLADAIHLTQLEDGSNVPIDLQVSGGGNVRLKPKQELSFWRSYALSVSGSELPCSGVWAVFSTFAPELVPPPLRMAAATSIARRADVVYSTSPNFHGLQMHRLQGNELPLLGELHWPAPSQSVSVAGERAYVPAGEAGVVVLDVAAPESPQVLAVVGVPGGASDAIGFQRDDRELLAVAAGAEGIVVMDVSEPEQPFLVSSFDVSGTRSNASTDVDLEGNVLAVGDGKNGLYSLDLTDPAAPVLLGRSADAVVRQVRIAGGQLYALFEGWPRIRSYDASQPTAKLSEWGSCGQPCGMFSSSFGVLGADLYVAARQAGVHRLALGADHVLSESSAAPLRARSGVFDVLASADATLIGEVGGLALFSPDGSGPFGFDPNGHGDASGVVVNGQRAYVAASFAGLQSFDLTDAEHPRWLGRADSPGMTSAQDFAATAVQVSGETLILSDGRAGLSLYDLTDPDHPALTASISDDIDRLNDIAVLGAHAYICNDNHGVDFLDLSDRSQPLHAPAVRFDSGHACRSLVLHPGGELLYMGDNRGIAIYAIDEAGGLTHAGDFQPPFAGTINALAIAGGRLIAASYSRDYAEGSSRDGYSTHLHVLDLSTPGAPTALWRSDPFPNPISTLAVAGQTLFVGAGTSLSVYDVSAATPLLEGSISTQSTIRQLAPSADAVYVAQSTGGLAVLRTGTLPGQPGLLPPDLPQTLR